jgi:hypothetical protein
VIEGSLRRVFAGRAPDVDGDLRRVGILDDLGRTIVLTIK